MYGMRRRRGKGQMPMSRMCPQAGGTTEAGPAQAGLPTALGATVMRTWQMMLTSPQRPILPYKSDRTPPGIGSEFNILDSPDLGYLDENMAMMLTSLLRPTLPYKSDRTPPGIGSEFNMLEVHYVLDCCASTAKQAHSFGLQMRAC